MPSWTQDMSVGVAKIDSEHQKLFELINGLVAGIAAGRGQDVLGPVLISLLRYTKVHFGDEEALLADLGYPLLEEHVKMHKVFRRNVEEIQKQFQEGKRSAAASTLSFLSDWLASHILSADAQYKPFLTGRDLTQRGSAPSA